MSGGSCSDDVSGWVDKVWEAGAEGECEDLIVVQGGYGWILPASDDAIHVVDLHVAFLFSFTN